jgi:predicted nucleic acid-binding protein
MDSPLLIVDTDILIDVSRHVEKAIVTLDRYFQSHFVAISVITQLELMLGCKNKQEFENIDEFLKRFEIIDVTKSVSQTSVALFKKFRLSHGVMIADMLIAATALEYKSSLLSKNQKDFRFIDELNLIEYIAP